MTLISKNDKPKKHFNDKGEIVAHSILYKSPSAYSYLNTVCKLLYRIKPQLLKSGVKKYKKLNI